MDSPTFDVRTQNWIPIVWPDGSREELPLRDVLVRAHDIRAIADEAPIVEFGLYRLLTAMVTDAFELAGLSRLGALLEKGRFDPARIDAYFDRPDCRDRFDLFHPTHPFLQDGSLGGEEKPFGGCMPLTPSGTNAIHFHHASELDFAVSPAATARLLTAIAPFMTAGGAGLAPSINGAPPWYILLEGRRLFQTICLNCCVLPLPNAVGSGVPPWRGSGRIPAEQRTSASLIESLTWQPRRIRLIPGAGGVCSVTGRCSDTLVRTMQFGPGARAGFEWRDPSVAYRIGDKGPTPLRPQEGKELWRDTAPLALLNQKDYQSDEAGVRFERPRLVDQFERLLQDRYLPEDHRGHLDLTAYGMRTDLKMKVFEWQRERLAIPAPLVWKSQFHRYALEAIELADSVAYQVQKAVKHCYPRGGKSNRRAFGRRIENAQHRFWSALREPYNEFLRSLATADEQGRVAATDVWKEHVRREGWEALGLAIDDLDTASEAICRQVQARAMFQRSVHKILQDPEEKMKRLAERKQRKAARGGSA